MTEIALTTSVSTTDHIFEQDQTVVLTCTCNEGKPTPVIVWTRDGEPLVDLFEKVVEEISESGGYDRVSSTLTITTQDFMNRAVYVCEVEGKEHLQQTYSMQVLCKSPSYFNPNYAHN